MEATIIPDENNHLQDQPMDNNHQDQAQEIQDEEVKESNQQPNQITDVFQCIVGLGNHTNEKDLLKTLRRYIVSRQGQPLPLKGLQKKRGGSVGFLQFVDRDQLHEFQELFHTEVVPPNPKFKLRDVTKKMNVREFRPVMSAEEERLEQERKKESRMASAEEIAEEMKVPVADRVTPYHKMSYEEQIQKKREQLNEVLESFSIQLDSDVKQGREDHYPNWYTQECKDRHRPCELSHIIECDEQFRNQYRNKVEFTIGHRYADNKVCVGFNTGNPSKGITFVDYPDGIKTNSLESILVAKQVEKLIIESGVETYDKKINQGYWRLLLYRESKQTNQVLISVIVTESFPIDAEKQKWIEEQLVSLFSEGTPIGTAGLKCVSLSMIFANELSGGYKETDKVKLLSGRSFIEEKLLDYKFQVSPFAFFQVNNSVFTKMLKLIEDFTQIDENTVLFDICCGTGAIGICLSKQAQKVVGIELIESAVENAKENVKMNEGAIDVSKCDFYAGRAEELLPNIVKEYSSKGNKIVGIVDPPRSGLHKDVLRALRTCKGLDRLVYVSCNPQSQMRDLAYLCYETSKKRKAPGFRPLQCIGADLFPHTNHVESIVLLERFYD